MEIKEVFAANLRALCTARGEPVNAIARAVGISRTQMDRYLNGEHLPNDLNLKKISAFFGISEVLLYSAKQAVSDDRPELADEACSAIARGLFGTEAAGLAEGDYQTFFALASDAEQVMVSMTLVRHRGARTVFRRLTRFADGFSAPSARYQGDHEGVVLDRLGGYYFMGLNKVGAREPSLALVRKLPVEEPLLGGRSLITSDQGPVVCAVVMRPLGPKMGLRDGLRRLGIVGMDAPLIGGLASQFLRRLLQLKG